MERKNKQPRPLKTTVDCWKAVSAFSKRDFGGALEALGNCGTVYAESDAYHHAVAFLHYKLATQSKDLDTVRKSLSDAAVSADRAWRLSRNSIFLAHFRASMLYLLLVFDQNYDEVIQECQEALAMEDPKRPNRDLFVFKDPIQRMKVGQMMEELRALIKHCEKKKSWVPVDSEKRYKECIKEIEERLKRAKDVIKSLSDSPDMKKVEDRGKKQASDLKNAMAKLEKDQDGKSFWGSERSPKEKENFFKVSIKDLQNHMHALKEHVAMYVVLEAIKFAMTSKTWKFWQCFHCWYTFPDFGSYTKHLGPCHDWEIPPDILPILPTDVNEISLGIIVNGGWKPVDIDETIKILSRTLLFGSKTDEKGSLSDLELPLCDDRERTDHLDVVCCMLQVLLRNECLTQSNVDMVIDLAVKELRDTITSQMLMIEDLKTLKLLCLLGSSQFRSILQYLQGLFDIFISSDNPEMGNSMDEYLIDGQGFDSKQKVILSEDFSFLFLDGSAVTSAGYEVGKEFESWKNKRDSRSRQEMELFHFFEEERSHLIKLSKERREHLRKFGAVNEVRTSCGVIIRGQQGPVINMQIYEPRLIELRKVLQLQLRERTCDSEDASELDFELKFTLDFISHILEIHEIENAYKFEYCSHSDDSLQKKIDGWHLQLSNDVCVDKAIMKRIVDVMKQYSLQLGHISPYDYRSIVLPVLKSFIQAKEVIAQPLLPQEEAERIDDPNAEIGPPVSGNEAALDFNVHEIGPSVSANEATLDVNAHDIGPSVSAYEATLDVNVHEIGPSVSAYEASFDVNVHEIGLGIEAFDCILNVIIQSLWNLREFPEEFMNRSKSHHKHANNFCVVCAFKDTFEGFLEGKVVVPASLRNALIVGYIDKIKSWKEQMEDASELLSIILESLHDSLISDLKLEKKASMDCFLVDCFVHKIFGMDHHERINCVKCKVESMHQKYSSLYLSLSTDNLRMKKNIYGEKSSDELLKLEMNRLLTCKACGQEYDTYHTLRRLPHVFTIGLVWEKPDESGDDISRTLTALSNNLDLSVLFQRCRHDNKYFLVSLVCYFGAQEDYNCFIYKQELKKYVEYNDQSEQVIGSWEEVVEACIKGCWQPTILFFHKKSRM